ncbi:hypothetical protein [Streptomyces phaeochromogenes]|uniref:hypothetical protein n=1 Tax=Streptomyces phaeochromogenes TaxID=1923 RepID=UPI0034065606|nr:hypothetical protein OHB08_18630 [Streptomyces phaeochromogenes]
MGEQRNRAADPGRDTGRTVVLPDLTDVDLRTLRAMNDPGLIAAVDQVLRSSREFGQVWYVGGEGGQRTFPVTGALEGEEGQG